MYVMFSLFKEQHCIIRHLVDCLIVHSLDWLRIYCLHPVQEYFPHKRNPITAGHLRPCLRLQIREGSLSCHVCWDIGLSVMGPEWTTRTNFHLDMIHVYIHLCGLIYLSSRCSIGEQINLQQIQMYEYHNYEIILKFKTCS